jgi:hypothetical protein
MSTIVERRAKGFVEVPPDAAQVGVLEFKADIAAKDMRRHQKA